MCWGIEVIPGGPNEDTWPCDPIDVEDNEVGITYPEVDEVVWLEGSPELVEKDKFPKFEFTVTVDDVVLLCCWFEGEDDEGPCWEGWESRFETFRFLLGSALLKLMLAVLFGVDELDFVDDSPFNDFGVEILVIGALDLEFLVWRWKPTDGELELDCDTFPDAESWDALNLIILLLDDDKKFVFEDDESKSLIDLPPSRSKWVTLVSVLEVANFISFK